MVVENLGVVRGRGVDIWLEIGRKVVLLPRIILPDGPRDIRSLLMVMPGVRVVPSRASPEGTAVKIWLLIVNVDDDCDVRIFGRKVVVLPTAILPDWPRDIGTPPTVILASPARRVFPFTAKSLNASVKTCSAGIKTEEGNNAILLFSTMCAFDGAQAIALPNMVTGAPGLTV